MSFKISHMRNAYVRMALFFVTLIPILVFVLLIEWGRVLVEVLEEVPDACRVCWRGEQ